MKTYVFEELIELTTEELEVIKKEKQDELYKVRQDKAMLCANIITLQGMIKTEMVKKDSLRNVVPEIDSKLTGKG